MVSAHVLMISPAFRPRIGGVERHVERVSERLAARGYPVTVLTPAHAANLPALERIGEVNVVRFAPIRLPLSTRARRALITFRCVRAADVVHCHDINTFEEYYWANRHVLPRRDAFATFHGFGRFPVPPDVPLRQRLVAKRTRGNICIGDFIAKWYGVTPTFVSYGGVDQHIADCGPLSGPRLSGLRIADSEDQTPDTVFVGRLALDTGVQVYVDALDVLKTKHALDLSLHVLGDGPLRAELERRATERGLRVTFHGFDPEVLPWVAGARVAFVSGYLGMLEAMALGKPVYAAYTHELKRDYLEMSPFAQFTTIVGSAADLAEALAAAWPPDPDSDAVIAARAFARQQTWDRVADTYLALYRTAGL